uniref:Putative conserved plasma membrane protein n=1 Tax=Amblyomma aureolatum TaxID=187763 RepID=A0A1E1X6R5_9ACAR
MNPTGGPTGSGKITPWRPLSLACRLYLYALHGYFIEVTFTAVWNLVASGSLELRGHSSVWSLVIYSVSCVAMENINGLLQRHGFALSTRALAHTCWIYAWEFTTGLVLRAMGWCPWDYSDFRYNVAGLVTLEYAPLWFLCGVLFEVLMVPNVKKLVWVRHAESSGGLGYETPVLPLKNGYVSPFQRETDGVPRRRLFTEVDHI